MRINKRTQRITTIALLVTVTLIVGTGIYQVSSILALPGFKYALMAPMYGAIMIVLVHKIPRKGSVLLFNTVFAAVMFIVNPWMGVAIIMCGLLTEVVILPIKEIRVKKYAVAIIYPMTVTFSALLVAKLFVGGVFTLVTPLWLLVMTLASGILGVPGLYVGSLIIRRLP